MQVSIHIASFPTISAAALHGGSGYRAPFRIVDVALGPDTAVASGHVNVGSSADGAGVSVTYD